MKPSPLVFSLALFSAAVAWGQKAPAGSQEAAQKRLDAIEAQIQEQAALKEKLQEVPLELAGMLVVMGEKDVANSSREQVEKLVQVRRARAQADLAEAKEGLAKVEAQKDQVPLEFLELWKAGKSLAEKKVGLRAAQLADAEADLACVKSGSYGQDVIDRKTALVDKAVELLQAQKKLELGR